MGVVLFTSSFDFNNDPGLTFKFESGETWQVALIVSGLATQFVAWRIAAQGDAD